VILPVSTILLDYLQHRTIALVEGMKVNEQRMRANLELTHGALFSQRVLLALVEGNPVAGNPAHPMRRDAAYRIVQELAQRAWDQSIPLRELLMADDRAAGLDLDAIFTYDHYTRHADQILARLDALA
jgi:adenylosuccinate lyase